MTYQEFIEFNKNKNQGQYTHKHHIIPKCVGGTDDKDNLIELSWLTHYYAHYLLAKENPDNKKIQSDFKRKGTINDWLHFCYSAKFHNEMTEEKRAKISKSLKGHVYPEERNIKISQTHKGKPKSAEHKKHISEAMKGNQRAKGKHWTLSEEARKHISESHKGKYKDMHWKVIDGKRVWYSEE